MNKDTTPFITDTYSSRLHRLDKVNKADTPYASNVLATATVIGCVAIDFMVNYTRWNLIMTESPLYVCMSAAACAIALDVPLAIAGIVLKRFNQGLCDKAERNLVMVLSILVFAIAFVCSAGLTYVTRDLVFGIDSAATITNTVAIAEEQAVEDPGDKVAVLVAALYSVALPLLTSLASFVVSYFSYQPIQSRLYKLESERIGLQNNLIEAERALAEADDCYMERLIARERDKYAEAVEMLNAQNVYLKEVARQLICEKMNTPSEADHIAENGRALFEEYENAELLSENALPQYILNKLRVNKENAIVAVDMGSEQQAA